jgi:hypothetical protein
MQRKPLDVGNGTVCASFGLDGSLLSVGASHPVVGFVELTAAPVFPAEHDGDADAVRQHRVDLLDPSYGVVRITSTRTDALSGEPRWRMWGPSWEAQVEARAVPDRPVVVQRYEIEPSDAGRLRLMFAGRLDRPCYAEITPVGPIPPALAANVVIARGPALELVVPGSTPPISAIVEVSARRGGLTGWIVNEAGAWLYLTWDSAADVVEMQLMVTMRTGSPSVAVGPSPRLCRGGRGLGLITAKALRYTLSCTAVAVSDGMCCIVTDHRLLPLSWTRDAYYQAALLLSCLDVMPGGSDVVGRHLTWLWGPGRDATGVWQRSHLTTGAVKDRAYQPDQQLYPLLELTDVRRVTGMWPTAPDDKTGDAAGLVWGELARSVWTGLPRTESGLLPGEENPADDPSRLPYLLSNQLLLAYVARRLAECENELGLEDLRLGDDVSRTLVTIREAFACDGPFGVQWAYGSDGADQRRLYHDANDVPTALAPLWGLCDPADPQWLATMRFAWSPHNPGFVPGPYGGLGSAHTPGVWPLGDAQEWAVAMSISDNDTAERVALRIGHVASDDGMLPETYDPTTGAWLARHWFAWPGALVGLLHQTVHHHAGPWVD